MAAQARLCLAGLETLEDTFCSAVAHFYSRLVQCAHCYVNVKRKKIYINRKHIKNTRAIDLNLKLCYRRWHSRTDMSISDMT